MREMIAEAGLYGKQWLLDITGATYKYDCHDSENEYAVGLSRWVVGSKSIELGFFYAHLFMAQIKEQVNLLCASVNCRENLLIGVK